MSDCQIGAGDQPQALSVNKDTRSGQTGAMQARAVAPLLDDLRRAWRSDNIVAAAATQHFLHVLVTDDARRHEFVDRGRAPVADRLELVVAAARARALLQRDFVFGAHSLCLRTIGSLSAAFRQSLLGGDECEAISYVGDYGSGWRSTPNAIEWATSR